MSKIKPIKTVGNLAKHRSDYDKLHKIHALERNIDWAMMRLRSAIDKAEELKELLVFEFSDDKEIITSHKKNINACIITSVVYLEDAIRLGEELRESIPTEKVSLWQQLLAWVKSLVKRFV